MTDTVHALPVLPLKNTVVFPDLVVPLAVGRPKSLAAVKAASEHNQQCSRSPSATQSKTRPIAAASTTSARWSRSSASNAVTAAQT